MRLKPQPASAATCSCVVTRGSTSIETSAPGCMGKACVTLRWSRTSCSGDRKVGVPPPQCCCVAARGTRSASRTAATSRSTTSRKRSAGSCLRVITLLQAQKWQRLSQNGTCT